MNHNIVTDDDGNEHQAVKDVAYNGCGWCSLRNIDCASIKDSICTGDERADSISAIYKRRIKLSDIIIKS